MGRSLHANVVTIFELCDLGALDINAVTIFELCNIYQSWFNFVLCTLLLFLAMNSVIGFIICRSSIAGMVDSPKVTLDALIVKSSILIQRGFLVLCTWT
jgi:hypothetical protein